MSIFKLVGDFLLSTWLWNITFDWIHFFFSLIIMFVLLRVFFKEKIIRSLLTSLFAQLFAFITFTVIAVGFVMYIFDLPYEPGGFIDELSLRNVMRANVFLALIYASLQTVFFLFFRAKPGIYRLGYIVIAWMSNGMAALLSYWLIRTFAGYSL